MWLTATEAFLGTAIILLEPIQFRSDSGQPVFFDRLIKKDLELATAEQFSNRVSQPTFSFASSLVSDRQSLFPNALQKTIALNSSTHNSLRSLDSAQQHSFSAGTTSWKTQTQLGSLAFDGKFDASAHFKQGKAIWSQNTVMGVVDFSVNLDDGFAPIQSVTGWQADTSLGSFTIEGHFSDRLTYIGSNAAWKAETSLGTVAVRGNFNEQTDFTGAKLGVATKTPLGSLTADVRINQESKFSVAKASWDANLLFGSSIGVDGKFDETTTFDGGSIKLGARTSLGNLGVKANVDRNTEFTSGSAFWKAKAGAGSIGLNVDVEQDGDFESKLGIEFPF